MQANRTDGRFTYGLEPSLRISSANDNYIHQAAAAYALARAARYFKRQKTAAIAKQALLTLLLQTETDPKSPGIRRPLSSAPGFGDIASAGWLVMAINELPAPGRDLLIKSEELCNFIRSRANADGSLTCSLNKLSADQAVGIEQVSSGPALCGLMLSLKHVQSTWKLEVVRKALPNYRKNWHENKNTQMIPWHSAACTEAYLRTAEQPFADFVNEMNDWMATLQHKELGPSHAHWLGGFKTSGKGGLLLAEPGVHSAIAIEGLGQACRLARKTGDVRRFQSHKESIEACCQFLMRLQYTPANTRHFAEWYRPEVAGGFHLSRDRGELRIDYTQEAVGGMLRYLSDVMHIQ